MRNYLFLLLLFTLFALPANSYSAEMCSLEVSFSFDGATDPQRELVGYRLYQEGEKVCETDTANTSKIICDLPLESGTHNFELTAYYSDGSESPQSPPFPFTMGSITDTPPESQGNKTITYSWEKDALDSNVAGYRMYMNDTFLCQTTDPDTESLSCHANLINGPMAFSIASVTSSNVESPRSNILTLDPSAFPEYFQFKSIKQTWEYTDSTKNAGGFRLYNNGNLLCKTTDASTRDLTCEAELSNATNIFTMTAVDANGIETALSNALVYASASGSNPEQDELQAIINAAPASGEIPLNVSFAGTASTGDIAAYSWEFGDGTTGTGAVVNHTYSLAGTYTAILTVKDQSGQSRQLTTTITAQPSTSTSTLPTAVLSSSTAAGNAPLIVNFDGSASTTANPPIASYSWTFGDGSEATGQTASHTFTTAGTYYTELTVVDSKGLIGKASTPVIVVGSVTANEKPKAVLSATPSQGAGPLTVSFDGSQSSDPDGTIVRYDWNFGDGSTATSASAQHIYTGKATYTASLQVTDDKGETATATKTIVCDSALPDANSLNIEVGEVSINQEWVKVLFQNTFSQPIVVVGPPSTNGGQPTIVRVRNINNDGFEIRLQEWDYLDGTHVEETVNYIVLEKGTHTLDNGLKIEAGSFSGSAAFSKISLQQPYDFAPVILTQVVSENKANAVTGRIKESSQSSFEYKLQEQETTQNQHTTEAVNYIAWETGTGDVSGLHFESGTTAKSIDHNWSKLTFQTEFEDLPFFIAGMQSYNGGDTAEVRTNDISQTAAQVKIEEEQSKDTEVEHVTEVVGYLAISSSNAAENSSQRLIVFNWDFDSNQENSISGFNVYNNGEIVCTANNPGDRTITCETGISQLNNSFSITAKNISGSETDASNTLEYKP